MKEEFAKLGVEIAAVSSNTPELAEKTVEAWGIQDLQVGHSLTFEDARRWGLHVSAGLGDSEPEHFSEPGLFLIRPDGTLFASVVQTMPFTRPPADALLRSIAWIIENDYPARGEIDPSTL